MRIRRYAARLLSSSSTGGATTAAPSSPPPPPAASWLHAAADDCCAFCDLNRSGPQEGPDAIKHKGHIAGWVPESDVRGDGRVRQAQHLTSPEGLQFKKCKTDHGRNVNKTSVGLRAPRGTSGVSEAGAEPAVKPGPLVVNDAAIGQEVKCKFSLTSDAAKPEVTGGDSLVNGSTTELDVLKDAPFANEAVHDPDVTDKVSTETKAATVTSIAPEVAGMPSRKAVTDPGVTVTMLRTGSLSTEGADGPEVTGAASIMHETTKLESAGEDYIASKPAAEPEDSGRASSNVDATAALDKSQLHSCNPNIGNVQLGNAGETVASAVQPSGCDAAKVGSSVNSTSNGPVGAKGPTVEGGMPNDRSVTPRVSYVFDIVARSIGTSGRTDIICYARRRGKRKLELLKVKMENIELEDGVVCEEGTLERTGRCESVLSNAGSVDVKLADIKKELMDDSAASKVKKTKKNRFECNIDYCQMTFKTKTELSVHKKNMCTVKSCSRQFRSHRYLRRHQSVHNDDMPYKCPWDGCGMAFKWSWDRTEHFKVHAGVKPYKCTTPGCNKIYKFVSDFTRHRRRCKPQR
ncbi:hypothetical protein SEVIR_9G544300v4 [Setaria viridis]|uniref:C2H2-type domain-containing protein n=1 Tax=Setaria viridis TaxID=4556 RepID=A0A4U6TBC8_SETVI|nr:zinc finger protein GLI1-like isoform X1 [Setaria viridis]TKV98203.1 hypothetical protein SEVIR_9G544300v2 [Setaria viridis]